MAKQVGTKIIGLINPFQQSVATVWKGLQIFRARPTRKYQSTSGRTALSKYVFARLASYWYSKLNDVQRAEWNEYAAGLTEGVGGGMGNVIPPHDVKMSGFNAFLGAAGLNISVGCPTGWHENAPLGVPRPSAPLIILASYDPAMGRVQVSWSDIEYTPPSPDYECTVYVRIWCDVQRRGSFHPFIAGAYMQPSPESMTFEAVPGGHMRGCPIVSISSLVGSMFAIQLDCVVICRLGTKYLGGVLGHPSYVTEFPISSV